MHSGQCVRLRSTTAVGFYFSVLHRGKDGMECAGQVFGGRHAPTHGTVCGEGAETVLFITGLQYFTPSVVQFFSVL